MDDKCDFRGRRHALCDQAETAEFPILERGVLNGAFPPLTIQKLNTVDLQAKKTRTMKGYDSAGQDLNPIERAYCMDIEADLVIGAEYVQAGYQIPQPRPMRCINEMLQEPS